MLTSHHDVVDVLDQPGLDLAALSIAGALSQIGLTGLVLLGAGEPVPDEAVPELQRLYLAEIRDGAAVLTDLGVVVARALARSWELRGVVPS